MENGKIGAEIRRLKQIKAEMKWDDKVGSSFDAWFDKLEYVAESLERELANLVDKVREISVRANINELEDLYTKLVKAYSEAEG